MSRSGLGYAKITLSFQDKENKRISKVKKKKITIAIIVLLAISLLGFLNYKNQRIHNIFDEIYYEEDDYHSYEFLFRKRAFSKVKDIKFYDNGSEDFYQHRVKYQENQLSSNITIMSYHFHFLDSKVPYFILEIRKKLANAKVTINIDYRYFPVNKTLEKNMWYFDGKTHIYEKEKIEDYLKQNGTSLDEVQSEFDRVLKEKILSDWTTIYPSRFTSTNWGEVDVKEYWEQRIVPLK